MRTSVMLLFAVLLLSAPASAQEYVPADSHERAALDLVEALNLERVSAASTDLMLESMVGQNPMLSQFRDIFESFFAEHMGWQVLLPHYVRMYRDAYTESELRELIAFYQTPIGRKWVRLTPQLMRQGAQIGQQQIQPHLPELQRRIQERLRGAAQP